MSVLLVAHRTPADARRSAALAAAGVRLFEVDVQLRDGQVVVSHYLPLPVIAGVDVRWWQRDNWRFRRAPGHDPLLVDLLASLPASADVLLDPKHHREMSADALQQALAEVVRAHGPASRFTVSTSAPHLLAGYREAGIGTWRSIGERAALRRILADGPIPESGVSVRHTLLDAETVTALHAVTGIIVAWTVNSVRRSIHLADLGVDGITTDSERVLKALTDRDRATAQER